MNVLSLFDGMSCGQQALERAGIKVENYFASEIDKYAIQVTMANYPNTKQLGSVVDLNGFDLPKIDLLIGGSPCQSFSFAGKRKGMSTKDEQEILTLEHYLELKADGFEFEGQSYLFWEYMRLLNETKPKYFLLENVKMSKKWKDILSKAIGVEPILINSNLVSAQNRQRLYWTNIGLIADGLYGDLKSIIEQPKNRGVLIKDILQDNPNAKFYLSDKMVDYVSKSGTKNFYYKPEFANLEGKAKPIVTKHIYRAGTTNYICEKVDEKYYLSDKVTKRYKDVESKSYVGTTAPLFRTIGQRDIVYGEHNKMGCLVATDYKQPKQVIINNKIRRLTPLECERLQTVKDNYTNYVSDTQRYRMLGNGWTVDVIAHIFSYIV